MKIKNKVRLTALGIAMSVMAWFPLATYAADSISLSVRDTALSEVMEMISLQQRVNILLADTVDARVSVNLFDVSLDEAIRSITNAAGYEVEFRDGTYFIITRDEVGRFIANGTLMTRAFRLQYADSTAVRTIIQEQLSSYGSVTALDDRNLLVVEDTGPFLDKVAVLIEQLDFRPRQILIEARILEVTLNESEAFGIEWSKIFENGRGLIGTRGLSGNGPGLFANYVNGDLEIFLDALHANGRTRTLSTPKLLTLENQPASVIVGDRLGYVNTVTINQVTTENTEFLESGVILEVTASVGNDGKILLAIRPEISTGTVNNGVPSQTTTSVRTQLLVSSGDTSFIGGLIKSQMFSDRSGVPGFREIPLAGRLFSRDEERRVNTEIVVLITPTLIDTGDTAWQKNEIESVNFSVIEAAPQGTGVISVIPIDSEIVNENGVRDEQSAQE